MAPPMTRIASVSAAIVAMRSSGQIIVVMMLAGTTLVCVRIPRPVSESQKRNEGQNTWRGRQGKALLGETWSQNAHRDTRRLPWLDRF